MAEPEGEGFLQAIADGSPIDWTAARGGMGDPAAARQLERLARVERIVRLHRAASADLRRLLDSDHHVPLTGTHAPGPRPAGPWGHLTIVEPVGAGGQSTVYRAWDTRLQREVALKIRTTEPPDADDSEAFAEAEGRLLARLRHPHVVSVFGADQIDGQAGIWMEFVRGRSLEQILSEQGPFGPRETMAIGLDISSALAAVHHAGLLHRDIKTQNVVREDGGRVVLMDLGSARDTRAGAWRTSDLSGTPLYLAPELLDGAPASKQSDLYSLGVLLYRMVTGGFPVTARTLAELRDAHARRSRASLRDARPDLPRDFVAAIERALAPEPADRFASAGEFELTLAATLAARPPVATPVTDPPRPSQRPRTRAAAIVLLMLVVIVGALLWRHDQPVKDVIPFGARDWIVVSDFVNQTGEADLDRVVSYSIERELTGSTHVNVVPRERIDDTLRLMKLPQTVTVDSDLACEVALRDGGIKLVLTGHLEKLGSTYVVVAKIVAPQNRQTLAVISDESDGRETLPRVIRGVSRDVRNALGETLIDAADAPSSLERVTTPSLRALRHYSDSYRLGQMNRWKPALELARQAIVEDPTFAAAHTWLAWALFNSRGPSDLKSPFREDPAVQAEYQEAAARGSLLSASMTGWERTWILGSQHMMLGEDAKAEAMFLALLKQHPEHLWATSNLSILYERQGRRADALPFLQATARMRPNNAMAQYAAAIRTLQVTGRQEQARPYVNRAREVGAEEDPAVLVWALFFEVADQLARRDADAVLASTRNILVQRHHYSEAAQYFLVTFSAKYLLAIGKVREAAVVAESLRTIHAPGPAPNFAPTRVSRYPSYRARIALAGGDDDAARRFLTLVTPDVFWGASAPLMVDLGMWAEVDALLRPYPGRLADLVRACAVAKQGMATDATTAVLESVASDAMFSHFTHEALRCLADVWIRRGQPARAIDALEAAIERGRLLDRERGGPETDRWANTAAWLAELYRDAGQPQRAELLAGDLRRLLAVADADLPLLQRVNGRVPSAAGR